MISHCNNQISIEPPSKFVSHIEEVEIKCKVLKIDLEGKADGRALKTIIPQINPKTVVLINGSSASNADFSNSVIAVPSFTRTIFSPVVGEQATIGRDTKSFSVRLGDSIMNSLKFSLVDGFEVAHVSGKLEVQDESSLPTLERHGRIEPPKTIRRTSLISSEKKADESHPTRLESLSSVSCGSSIFIGDLRLAGLKSHLISLDIPAEFAAEGVLVCGPVPLEKYLSKIETKMISTSDLKEMEMDKSQLMGGTVAVRKTTKGQVVIEGSIGITFLLIRDAVYNLHARTKA